MTQKSKLFVTGGSGFIGTSVVSHFAGLGWEVRNFDTKPPNLREHDKMWVKGDVRDAAALRFAVVDFRPDFVLNMAAATGAHLKNLTADFFSANVAGVSHLIDAMAEARSVKRAIFVSSLLVCRNGYIPSSDTDYCAPNAYGQSKVDGEMVVRGRSPEIGDWVILRPTSVWGPWFEHSYRDYFRLLARGLYVNIPGVGDAVKPITFVDNAAYMMERFFAADASAVSGKTFYLVDYPEATINLWTKTICAELGRELPPTAPAWLIKSGARIGDGLVSLGWKNAPLTTFRLNNMSTGGHYPYEKTAAVVGPLPHTMMDGVRKTVDWMRTQGLIAAAS